MCETARLLEIKNLKTTFSSYRGQVQAVDGVSFLMVKNRHLGIVGESGCGKTVTGLSVMGLIPQPPGRISGEILYYNSPGTVTNLTKLPPNGHEYRSIRGAQIAMIFQEPMSSLNPVYTVGAQIGETIVLHQKLSTAAARELSINMLDIVGISDPGTIIDSYPHQLSGGMRQRVMIAMALSCNPSLLIADEPTTALDVTTQAQILELLLKLEKDFNTSIMMITHDLGIIATMTDQVIVMYLGRIVECATTRNLYKRPLHPYTQGLLKSVPRIGVTAKQMIEPIEGSVQEPIGLPERCRFAPRCRYRMDRCEKDPPIFSADSEHKVACWLYETSTKNPDE